MGTSRLAVLVIQIGLLNIIGSVYSRYLCLVNALRHFLCFFGVPTQHDKTLNETVFLAGSFLSSLLLHLAFGMSR